MREAKLEKLLSKILISLNEIAALTRLSLVRCDVCGAPAVTYFKETEKLPSDNPNTDRYRVVGETKGKCMNHKGTLDQWAKGSEKPDNDLYAE